MKTKNTVEDPVWAILRDFARECPAWLLVGLDLGTTTGVAYSVIHYTEVEQPVTLGALHLPVPRAAAKRALGPKLARHYDARPAELGHFLCALPEQDAIAKERPRGIVVAFEDVLFRSTTYQAQLWGSLRAAVWLCPNITRHIAVPVQTIKRHATGNGHADKAAMLRALQSRYGPYREKVDENAVDAFWVLDYVRRKL